MWANRIASLFAGGVPRVDSAVRGVPFDGLGGDRVRKLDTSWPKKGLSGPK